FSFFFFSSRRRHTRSDRDWSSDVCSSDLSSPLAPLPSLLSPRSSPLSLNHQKETTVAANASNAPSRFIFTSMCIGLHLALATTVATAPGWHRTHRDRKSTRLNPSHAQSSY